MVEKDGFRGDVTGSGEMKEGISGKRLGIGGRDQSRKLRQQYGREFAKRLQNGSGDEFAEGAGFASEIECVERLPGNQQEIESG